LLHPWVARDFFLDRLRIDAPDAHPLAQAGGLDDLAAADLLARLHLDLAHGKNLVIDHAVAQALTGVDRALPVDRDEDRRERDAQDQLDDEPEPAAFRLRLLVVAREELHASTTTRPENALPAPA